MKVGDKVRILRGDYKGVIATVDTYRQPESGRWRNFNVGLILPLDIVTDGESVPYHEYELELVEDS